MTEYLAQHRTPRDGTFQLAASMRLGSIVWEILHKPEGTAEDFRVVGFDLSVPTAIQSLLSGRYDETLGFNAAAAGVPEHYSDWNGFA